MIPVPVPPSPKFQLRAVIVPSESLDAAESTDAVRSAAVAVNDADGGWFGGGGPVTVTCRVVLAVAPSSSVTVNVTVYVPAVA